MSATYDEVGYWSEVKLDIVREYAAAYSRILATRTNPSLYHIYIDAFAGAGVHVSRSTGDYIPGSPQNALLVTPPFREYHLIDLDAGKAESLRAFTSDNPAVKVYEGDCNHILLNEVFPRALYTDFKRALCLLDPYGLHLSWEVIQTAGQMKTVDMFLNFPIHDMNRNALRHDQKLVSAEQAARMTFYWGDDSWRGIAYDTTSDMFGYPVKQPNAAVVSAFRERLKKVAGFEFVPEPMPMRNSMNAELYYLFFASHQKVGDDIIKGIFRKHRDRRG